MTLKGSGETKHRGGWGRDGTNHFTPFRPVRCNFSDLCFPPFHLGPIVLPGILKNLLSSPLSTSSTFFNVLHDTFPRWMREKFERERWSWTVGEKENPGRLHRVEGLCLIKPGNETSMIRFPVGGWVGFFRARFAAQTAFQPRIESNRKEPRRH